MRSFLLYALVATFSCVLFIVVLAPASVAWRMIEDDVRRSVPELDVTSVSGSVWDGRGVFTYGPLPASSLEWKVDPLAILRKSLAIDALLTSDGLELRGPIEVSPASAALDLTGFIAASYANPIATKYGLTFPGVLEIEQLQLNTNRAWFTRADGKLHWTGGDVSYRTWEGPKRVSLPPLDGKLWQLGDELRVDVTAQGNSLLTIGLQPTGWAKVEIRSRLFVLAELPWPADQDQDANALVLEEKLF